MSLFIQHLYNLTLGGEIPNEIYLRGNHSRHKLQVWLEKLEIVVRRCLVGINLVVGNDRLKGWLEKCL